MSMKIYNTLSRSTEEFVPLQPGKVRFYMCGPTVYDYIHIGNARAFIVFDVLRRFLEFQDYQVAYVMNLTDIDDRIIERAQRDKVDTKVITEKYSEAFFKDLEMLGVKSADVHPRATDNVEMIIGLIEKLVEKDMAYNVDGNVFFNVAKFGEYGKLSGKKLDELRVGARVSVDENKQSPLDFALWKKQKPGEPAWESPWGPGRPGWHIECSAMSMKHLGETFDIHAGGTDLIFPHHENEVAQSEGATGKPFVRYWLHNGFLQIDGDKMSKSLGNFRTVRDVLKKYSGVDIRLFFLQKHYRNPIDLTEEGLQAAHSAATRLNAFYQKLSARVNEITQSDSDSEESPHLSENISKLRDELIAAMQDDMNTPMALAKLFDIIRQTNSLLSKDKLLSQESKELIAVKNEFEKLDSFLGLLEKKIEQKASDSSAELIDLLIEVRRDLRTMKQWELADKVRDRLSELGIVLEDSAKGTEWHLK